MWINFTLIPDGGRYCNIIKRHIVIKPATSMLSRSIDLVKIDIEHIVSLSSLCVECGGSLRLQTFVGKGERLKGTLR